MNVAIEQEFFGFILKNFPGLAILHPGVREEYNV